MNAPFPPPFELIVDSFAGGGGTSEGIRMAIGRDPDIAINHDADALAMHRINHPATHHMVEDVWSIDALGMCDGRPIGLLWLSPDCKHFSKAKGGKPRDKDIRGLAWVGLRWVKSLPKRQRPRVIILENVEEFQNWGPLLADGKPCPVQKGATFKAYIGGYQSLGYVAEWRELRACDYGDPTIRKRLFVILRRDGKPIVWPVRTHGNPKDPKDAALIAAGDLRPWRTAAEIIDWSLPCPSIFETSAEIKASLGIRANRPLADNTMARVAKGTMRYVVDALKPFIVKINHTGRSAARSRAINEPLSTLTSKRDDAIVVPFLSYGQHGGANRDVSDPMHTLTASRKDQNVVVAPFVTKFNRGSTGHSIDQPLATVTSHASETHGGGAAPLGLVAPILVGCGGRAAQSEPRAGDEPILTQTAKADLCMAAVHLSTMRNAEKPFNGADEPTHTITAGGASLSIVSSFLVPRYGERPGQEPRTRAIDEPAPVIVPTGNEGSLAAVHLSLQFGASIGAAADEPAPTVTAGGAGKSAVVAAFLAQHNTGVVGRDVVEPVSTLTAMGTNQNLVAAHMLNMRGADIDAPLRTLTAQGNHAALVAAFIAKYYGSGEPVQGVDDPLHTLTVKPRHGLVMVHVQGEPYIITDIGMRMLTPRERFSAQGFRPDYVIDRGVYEDGTPVLFTLEQQGRMCGNSVCPGMARALVSANYVAPAKAIRSVRVASAPLFEAAK